jgi:pSer/pThr/pTyr-binding forkhead associated (FHA) protein
MQAVSLQTLWVTGKEDTVVEAQFHVEHFPWIIGRSPDCDGRLENPLVSRRHCSLFERDGEVWVQDLGSQNGTRLNGERLTAPRPIHDGDRLDLACLPFLVRLPRPEGQASWPVSPPHFAGPSH